MGENAEDTYDITIRSASDSKEVVEAVANGKPVPEPEAKTTTATTAQEPTAEEKAAAEKATADAAAAEALAKGEADEPVVTGETDEQRTAREGRNTSRAAKRQQKFDQDIAARRRELGDLDRQIAERHKTIAGDKSAAPQPGQSGDGKTDDATAAAPNAVPEFTFPTFEEWQDQAGNESKGLGDYTDARTDARVAWHRQKDAIEAQTRANADRIAAARRDHDARMADFRTATPDYDTVVEASEAGFPEDYAPAVHGLLDGSKLKPQVLYYLAQHPDEAKKLVDGVTEFTELVKRFGRLEDKAETAATARVEGGKKPPADTTATAPLKPTTNAPIPVTPVAGAASAVKTSAELAKEDPMAWIRQRDEEEEKARGR